MMSTGAGNGEDRLEHEHEVVELGAPFAQVFGPEIFDSNLSDFEFRLLAHLRLSAATNGSTWMSHRRMAKYLGKSEKTVKRAYSELMKKGFAKSQKRSYAQTSKKILTAPSKIYGKERMRNVFTYLRSDTSDEDIAFLRMVDLDSHGNSIGDKNDPNDDLDSHNNSIGDKNDPLLGDKNDPSLGTNLGASRSRSSEVDEEEVDQTHTASQRVRDPLDKFLEENTDPDSEKPKKTKGDRYRDRFEDKPHVETLETSSDDERLAASQAAVDAEAAASAQRAEEANQKAMKGWHARRLASEGSDASQLSGKRRERLSGKGGMNCHDAKELYLELMKDFFPKAKPGRWQGRELAHAKELIDDYGWDLVERVITNACKNWSELSRKMKNEGEYPTIVWIYGFRHGLFADAQKNNKPAFDDPEQPKRRKKQGELLGD
jgi:hypothetical protein